MIYVEYAIIILESHDNKVAVTAPTAYPGKMIHESISRIKKGMAKAYQVRQVLRAIERLENENKIEN